ncbi:MAG: alanine--tRNA ligase [Candidatus Marinimicrobia bacterium]|nr:alanine--tRNA ligase [Candidatus Neomarinimicrobiota bacterium]
MRQEFISFFEERGHRFVRSSPVVPLDDPTLLFTNAGMNQFKPIFLGERKPDYNRAVNSQKCIRVSGKHNDLEEVGVDNYHHTFFEMLGNWSFGDYYKAEAIEWAWELLTGVWGLDKRRLWATVHDSDDEAAQLWTQVTDIPASQVLRFGDKENFWEMGETGPCGPCSEIHYYDGPDISRMTAEGVNAGPEYKELWNLVFIQNRRLEDGALEDLPAKHVDTGAGLERIVAVIQGQTSNYATDLFIPLIEHVAQLTGVPYDEGQGVAHRVLADHIRMLAFSLADGALPGNEGRGYVVRRILRRAARFGRQLGQLEPFIYRLVPTLVDIMGEAYPELGEKRQFIAKVIKAEETAFGETLDRGLELFGDITSGLQAGDTLSGDEAFKLYDTYGFPLDLTELMARERGITVDQKGFDKAMAAQKKRARGGGKGGSQKADRDWTTVTKGRDSVFRGHETTQHKAVIRKYRLLEDQAVEVILDQTPFYAEAGGQIGDTGTLTASGLLLQVMDTQKSVVDGHEVIVHECELRKGDMENHQAVHAKVNQERRQAIRLNHTATHLMHQALKVVLGDHIQQAGSLVAPDRLRFDLTHYEKLTSDEIERIETMVNQVIRENQAVDTKVMGFDEARESGAVALFGEKYGDEVRVVDVPGFSKELCGGTHVERTGDIGAFKITAESSLAAGVRRIEAVTGAGVFNYYRTLVSELDSKAEKQRDRIKQLERQLRAASKAQSADLGAAIAAEAQMIEGVRFVSRTVEIGNIDQLKDLAAEIKHKLKSAVVTLGTVLDGKPLVVVAVTDDLKERVPAGKFVKELGRLMGGGGGGTSIMATAGGKDPAKLEASLNAVADKLKIMLTER